MNKKMKTSVSFALICAMLLTTAVLSSCGSNNNPPTSDTATTTVAATEAAATTTTSASETTAAPETTITEEPTAAAESFSEKDVPVLRDRLDSTETAAIRYYNDMPDIPYMSVTDFYDRFELAAPT